MTPTTAAMATSVVTPEMIIRHRTLATMPAAAGSRGFSSSVSGSLMTVQHRRKEKVVIAGADAGERLHRRLAARIAALSRSRLKALILAGEVAIGGRTIRDPGHHVNAGDAVMVDVPPPEPAEPARESIPLNVVFEDDEIIVIDKPRDLVVHPAAGNWTGTLVNALIAHCGDSLSGIGGVRRPGIVHRLDKDTTRLMVGGKTDPAHQTLSR